MSILMRGFWPQWTQWTLCACPDPTAQSQIENIKSGFAEPFKSFLVSQTQPTGSLHR